MTYYLAPTGNDSNDGSITKPFKTLTKVWTKIQAGDTVLLRGGKYEWDKSQNLAGKNGAAGKLINIWAYEGEVPILTKSANYPESQQDLIFFEGDYFHFRGLEIAHFAQQPGGYHWPAFRTHGMSHSIMENINYHHNGAGMSIRGNSTDNLFINCDFHSNSDPYSSPAYENADGIDLHYVTAGMVNTLRGCRAYWNADDGFDCWDNNGNVIFENCWSFYNGYQPGTFKVAGNGSGFKLGTTGDNASKQLRTIKNCLAYKNRSYGIVKNEANCLILVENCTVVETGELGLWSGSWNTTPTTYNKNISYKQSNKIGSFDKQTGNSWQGKTVTDADFISMDPAGLTAPRGKDGSLPALTFLMVAPGSDLAGLGYTQGGVVIPPPPPPTGPTVETVIHYYTDKTAFVTDKPKKTLKFDIEVMSDGTVRKK